MKITLDTKTSKINVGKSIFGENMDSYKMQEVESALRSFLINNTNLSNYEEDCMWMSYRYAIGRHTYVSMHAGEIWKHCKGRMSKERQLFTAFDINREIEQHLAFHKPYFHFPLTSLNRIYTTAVDIVLQFMEDYEIKSVEDFLKYRDIHVILTDNERGYKLETVTWEEYLRPRVLKIMRDFYHNDAMSEECAWNHFQMWMNNEDDFGALGNKFEELTRDMPNKEHYYFHDLEDLFVWNDLVHCFDYEHYHKSLLIDGTEVEWFWSWVDNVELRDDGYYYKTFGYRKVRRPVNEWKGDHSPYIPDESIVKDLY